MRTRRDMMAALGGAVALPATLHAQRSAVPVIGYLSNRSAESEKAIREPFLAALGEMGFVPGRNVAIDYQFGDGQEGRLPAIVGDFVQRRVAILVATDRAAAVAATAGTKDIPIVFTSGTDPVQLGMVASFSRPGGNATGVSILTSALGPKRLGLLRELLPQPGTIAFVAPPSFSNTPQQIRDMRAAAQAMGQDLLVVDIDTEEQAESAFAMMAERKVAAILYSATTVYQVFAPRLIGLAARYQLPALYEWREFVDAGGLMSYSTDRKEAWQVAGNYAGRILRGEKPADLPVVQSSRFELVINLKTARAMGLDVPASLLARADEVIE